MFATVATTAMVNVPAAQRRGRAVSLLLMSETSGLLLGTAASGWLYQGIGITTPFLFEATCMVANIHLVELRILAEAGLDRLCDVLIVGIHRLTGRRRHHEYFQGLALLTMMSERTRPSPMRGSGN
jgi:hypothetical protein